jgi:trigger factor
MKDVAFPDEFLKRWLLETSSQRTPEQLEEDFPRILEDLKFHIAKQKIMEENELRVEYEDVEALATEVARAQFAQYGMTNLPADVLQNYTKSLLEKEETLQNLVEQATDNKVIEWLKANVTVVEKEIYSKEFNDLMSEHSHSHQEEAQEEAAAEDETEE